MDVIEIEVDHPCGIRGPSSPGPGPPIVRGQRVATFPQPSQQPIQQSEGPKVRFSMTPPGLRIHQAHHRLLQFQHGTAHRLRGFHKVATGGLLLQATAL
eukprot:CAMPEP_0114563514 /NCGR_PEP_ID=MMETSP0114-20121206/13155_1 /TAXON_ID=31324 /ORGANISM="Goniomonas sp, Strain m" /LENGTH=98 /DNA_ID=CAMNT_0001749375 /DNA_START=68 /DNA_END=364 /DNA_ORIENTATION=+